MADPLKPSVSLLVKLGSIATHAAEMTSPLGHGFDKIAMTSLFVDPEVVEFMRAMNGMALLPVPRTVGAVPEGWVR